MTITQDWSPKSTYAPGPGVAGRIAYLEHAARPGRQIARKHAYKGVMDRLFAALGLIVLLPLMLVLCALIRLSSRGPAFHRQERVGQHGKIFRIIKMRSMIHDAERHTGPIWASARDPRVTPIGRFLRKTHLDEMPQLFNVLLGDMSLVGPRPERPVFVEQFKGLIPNYVQRLQVKPGITGLAQIHHRYDVTLEDVRTKLGYDFLYMRRMSLKMDLSIMLRTVRPLMGGGPADLAWLLPDLDDGEPGVAPFVAYPTRGARTPYSPLS